VDATAYQGERSGKNYAFVDAVARKNVELNALGTQTIGSRSAGDGQRLAAPFSSSTSFRSFVIVSTRLCRSAPRVAKPGKMVRTAIA
jgi:hypothetical protein